MALPAAQQDAARMALNAWASVSGIHFVEMPDVFGGQGVDLRIRLGFTWQSYQVTSPLDGGDITLNTSYANLSMAPGTDGYVSLLLSIGYALGFNSVGSDLFRETVMASYSPSNPKATALGSADLEAVRYTYGTQEAEDALHVRWSWDPYLNGVRHEGDNSDQIMTGGDRRDLMFGGGGNDTLAGNGGNDLLAAGIGVNTVTGGNGIDTLMTGAFRAETSIVGRRTSYEIDGNGRSYDSYIGTLNAPAESTSFHGIEIFHYADGRMVFDESDPVAQVTRLYKAVLGRLPDAPGREGWTAQLMQGESLANMATQFTASAEFINRFGSPSESEFITRAYQLALGRDPDANGMQSWQYQLANGMTRGEMLTHFSESSENRAATSSLVKQGLWDADEGILSIARLYKAVLGRAPDANGLHFWDQKLEAGTSMMQMADGFAGSAEFTQRFGAADNSAFVHLVYANTLGRGPDPVGLGFWLNRLDHGTSRAELVLGFSESQEFILQNVSMMEGGIAFA